MFCPICGRSLIENANFCEHCGAGCRRSESKSNTSSNGQPSEPTSGSGPSNLNGNQPPTFKEYLERKCGAEDVSFASIRKRKVDDRFVQTKKGKKDETVKVHVLPKIPL